MLSPRCAVSKYKGQSCCGIKIIPQQIVLEEGKKLRNLRNLQVKRVKYTRR
jgi:hypothetical protein